MTDDPNHILQSEESDRLLAASREIGKIVLSSLEVDTILDELGRLIVEAGFFRSLMIALVDEPRHCVEVVRNFICKDVGGGN